MQLIQDTKPMANLARLTTFKLNSIQVHQMIITTIKSFTLLCGDVCPALSA